jgi:hypothetical protein
MTIVTPEWVKDAVFYPIVPDRFARNSRVHAPGPLDAGRTPGAYATDEKAPLDLSAARLADRDGTRSLRQLGYQAWRALPPVPKLYVRNPGRTTLSIPARSGWVLSL